MCGWVRRLRTSPALPETWGVGVEFLVSRHVESDSHLRCVGVVESNSHSHSLEPSALACLPCTVSTISLPSATSLGTTSITC